MGNREDDPDVLQADCSWSDDDGLTWQHRRITAAIKDPAWGGIFAASGRGIQLRYGARAGRLVQQYVVRHDGANYAASAFSDDHGITWRMGKLLGPGLDENKTVELADGRLIEIVTTDVRRTAPRYSPDDLGRCLRGYRSESAMLLRNGMQEFLFRALSPS